MINVINIRKYSKIKYLLLLLLVVFSGLQFFAPSAHAYGEKYTWLNAMTINASDGRYGGLTYTFKADKTYTPGRDNIPDFTVFDQINDSEDSCVFGASLRFTGKDASKATFEPDISILTCSSETVAKYDARVALLNASNQNSNPSKNRTITVKSQITKGNPYPNNSDVITLKELKSGDVVGTKKVNSGDAYSDVEYAGFKTSFGRLSNDLAYTACSKSLSLCESTIANPGTGTPADDLANQITISKTIVEPDSSGTTCAVEGVGWIVCPAAKFLGIITDGLFKLLTSLLEVESKMFSTANDSYAAWAAMRNLANVAFIVAFLVIIYSQISGLGVSNYGIKKMLPRIVIAAILVNVSYWICALAVDISNILGVSLQALLSDSIGGVSGSDNALTGWGEVTAWILAGGATALAVGGVTLAVLGSGGFLAALALLLPILVTALFAIITVVLVLAARQAIIVILVVISPLAFVAYLLPNTEQWFDKWRKLFFTLLLLFPIISVIFGGSQLAAAVIRASTTSATVYILSLAVQVVPLFITPLVLKFSGGLLNRFGGIVNNPSKGPFDKLRKSAEGVRDRQGVRSQNASINSSSKRNPFRRYLHGRARKEAVNSSQQQGFEAGKAGYISDLAQNDANFLGKMASGGGAGASTRALASAINVQLELEAKEVKAASAVIEHANLSSTDLNSLAKGEDARGFSGKDDAFRKAAISSAVSVGTVGDVEDIIKSAGSMSKDQHKILSSAIASSGITNKATHLGGQTLDDIAQGNITSEADLDRVTARAIEKGKYSAEKIADSDPDTLKRVVNVLSQQRTDVSVDKATAIKEQAELAATDGRIKSRLTDAQKPHLDQLR